MKMYQIGHFSKITKLTVKALRFYHEKGIISPSYIDDQSGYRYYNETLLEKAYTIRSLKELEFSLKEITEIMRTFNDDSDMVAFLRAKTSDLETKIDNYTKIKNQLDVIINSQEKLTMKPYSEIIETRDIPDIHIAGIRYKGKYSDIGNYFSRLFKLAGFNVKGKPGALYYNLEYKEDDADVEAFVPVKKGFSKSDITSRILPGGKAHCLIHKGPYETLTRSYKKMLDYVAENNFEIRAPIREILIKGPGMIFRGNPEKYITELQFFEKDCE